MGRCFPGEGCFPGGTDLSRMVAMAGLGGGPNVASSVGGEHCVSGLGRLGNPGLPGNPCAVRGEICAGRGGSYTAHCTGQWEVKTEGSWFPGSVRENPVFGLGLVEVTGSRNQGMWDPGGGKPPVCVCSGRGGVPGDPEDHPFLLRAGGQGCSAQRPAKDGRSYWATCVMAV